MIFFIKNNFSCHCFYIAVIIVPLNQKLFRMRTLFADPKNYICYNWNRFVGKKADKFLKSKNWKSVKRKIGELKFFCGSLWYPYFLNSANAPYQLSRCENEIHFLIFITVIIIVSMGIRNFIGRLTFFLLLPRLRVNNKIVLYRFSKKTTCHTNFNDGRFIVRLSFGYCGSKSIVELAERFEYLRGFVYRNKFID